MRDLKEIGRELVRQIENFTEHYRDEPVLHALAQLVPFSSPVDTWLGHKVEEIRIERARVFFDELASGVTKLTRELVETEDFLHKYFSTLRAALNSRRREKIRLFAKLLKTSVRTEGRSEDEFDSYLSILDDLSMSEIRFLALAFEKGRVPHYLGSLDTPVDQGSTTSVFHKHLNTPDVRETNARILSLFPKEIVKGDSHLLRLMRTGLVEMEVQSEGNDVPSTLYFQLTDAFPTFMRALGFMKK